MLENFKHHIDKQFPFLLKTRILITVSGGLDSMVLLYLCQKITKNIAVAHCNFQLRGSESDGDTSFVEHYCNQHKITFYKKYFDTSAYAKASKTSTQIAARELRYQWFSELSVVKDFDHILTAHHLNDDLETFLINLGRGTGINGLIGIPSVNEKVVRPLLTFSRKRIEEYAIQNNLKWREDSSNATDHYQRNHLRHYAIPALEEAQPNIFTGFQKTQLHLQQSTALLKVYTDQLRQQLVSVVDDTMYILVKDILSHPEPKAALYILLEPYGFTAWNDIYNLLKAQTGKQVLSPTHRLVKNRDELSLTEIRINISQIYTWQKGAGIIEGGFGKLSQEVVDKILPTTRLQIFVDAAMLEFPLTIRTWEKGDFFYPYGLGGKKKLGKFYKDEKLSLITKEKTWLLCQGDSIIWVVGMRADDRFQVTDKTKKIIKITLYDT